ncbi:centromere-associated protein E isoform X2 [Entelurus aequoreus]|uniref:centromere-associated protein E isoform X2 n=1 Tax=Entelurus aequoreus TaxID=161455 RepID=UPI002B1D54D5|nr:centromere-associated protein E isoform X2 [Entelurus aequoreus]
MAEESAVKVCVRVRPTIEREESVDSDTTEPVQLFWKADKKSIYQIDDGNSTKSFSFDRVFTAEQTTDQLYQAIAKPLVVSTVEGYNGTIFAYGQTSSGKTFTMMGSGHAPGVIPMAVEDVFQTIKKNCPNKKFLLRVSYMEIYNETVTDLLVGSWKRKPLEVRETLNKNIYVADLTEEVVNSPAQALAWIRKGEKNRHYEKTKMNQRSSRSHTIFRMILESERSDPASGENSDGAVIVSHLNLVDLAGSERASQTGAEGARFKEGCNINRSLFTLGQVIKKLSEESQRGFTNYRDSKLTRILQNSLGGNAKTVIICTITAAALDETLSTLQFASTAKKMKNDPHVTEVSDDGALLKRYRNEIVELKRRLHEVSSGTQTTATEKEVLSQLIQEKDQLQREQEDRIKNLTKLLVTSTNVVQKFPKRRVTWGGKMMCLAAPGTDEGSPSNRSFAGYASRKRKSNRSCMMELTEDDEDFDSLWEIPEEPSDDTDSSPSFVSVRCSKKSREAELDLELQTVEHQNQQALEKILEMEEKAAEVNLQLKSETQQRLEAESKVEMLELSVAEMKRQLEEQSHVQCEADKQLQRDFGETIQLCENLATEKDMLANERDSLKQDLDILRKQTTSLQKDITCLSRELEEKKENDEFICLEKQFGTELEDELKREVSSLKIAMESRELQCLELQKTLDTVSEELKQKTKFAADLQNMNGKNLVEEVTKLRRSLDDVEGLSIETKKEWAVLRSENIALEELKMTLTLGHEKMAAEVNSLRFQLDAEKSRFKKMQLDLQKELNVVFDENTKLTALLDGKLSKNQIERTVINLNKELAASKEAEGALRAQLEEMTSLQALPNEVDNLNNKLTELTEELIGVQTQRDELLSSQAACQEEIQQLKDNLQKYHNDTVQLQDSLSATTQRETDLMKQCTDAGIQLEFLQSDLEQSEAEKSRLIAVAAESNQKVAETQDRLCSLQDELQLQNQNYLDLIKKQEESEVGLSSSTEEIEKLVSEVTALTAERDSLKVDMQDNVEMMIENQDELRTALEKICALKRQVSQLEDTQTSNVGKPTDDMTAEFGELQTQIKNLSEELERVKVERDGLLVTKEAGPETSQDEIQKLLCKVMSLSEERDQLHETVEGLREEKNQLREELEERMAMIQCGLQQELLGSAAQSLKEEQEAQQNMQIQQLQQHLEKSQEEVTLLKTDLQESQELTKTLTEELDQTKAEKNVLLAEKEVSCQSSEEDIESGTCRVMSLSEECSQLQKTVEDLKEEKQQISIIQEKMSEQNQLSLQQLSETKEREAGLQQEIKNLSEELECVKAERDSLIVTKEDGRETSQDEIQKLLSKVMSLSEERDQLHETVEGLRQEKNHIRAELEMQCGLQQEQLVSASLKEEQEAQQNMQIQQLEEHLEKATEEVTLLKMNLQENLDLVMKSQAESREAQEKVGALQDEINILKSETQYTGKFQELQNQDQKLAEELEDVRAERDALQTERLLEVQTNRDEIEKLMAHVTSLNDERNQLQGQLEAQRQEISQLRAQLEDVAGTYQTEVQKLAEELEGVRAEQDAVQSERSLEVQTNKDEMEKLMDHVTSLNDERNQLQTQLEAERQEMSQLRAELEDMAGTYQTKTSALTEELHRTKAEKDVLLAQSEVSCQSSAEEIRSLTCRVMSLSEERAQLQETLEELKLKKQRLTANHQAENISFSEKLKAVETERYVLLAEKEVSCRSSAEKIESLNEELAQSQETLKELKLEEQLLTSKHQAEKMHLTEKLKAVEAEKDALLSDKEVICQSSAGEIESLTCRVTSLSEECVQMRQTLDELREEKKQLQTELQNKISMISTIQNKMSDQNQLSLQQQAESREREAGLQQEVQQLEEQLNTLKRQSEAHTASATLQQLPDKDEASVSVRNEKLGRFVQNMADAKGSDTSEIQDPTVELQKSFGRLLKILDCSTLIDSTAIKEFDEDVYLSNAESITLPQATLEAHNTVCHLGTESLNILGHIGDALGEKAKMYKNLFEELINKDLFEFEECRRKLCTVQVPTNSVQDQENLSEQERRTRELLRKRHFYLEKMEIVLKKLLARFCSCGGVLSADIKGRDNFEEQFEAGITSRPVVPSRLDSMLSLEVERRSEVIQSRKMILQGIMDDDKDLSWELRQLDFQVECYLGQQRQKQSSWSRDYRLILELEESREEVEELRMKTKQLEEAQLKANNFVSSHEMAFQQLQTQMQSIQAQVEEKENAIHILNDQLQKAEKNASAAQLEKVCAKLRRMEMEMSSAFDRHQTEIQKITLVLHDRDRSVRRLKETLRTLQQGEESFLQGEELHERLVNPRGLVVKSSLVLEKTKLVEERTKLEEEKAKLQEEVKQLHLKITHLDKLVFSHQAEITKWKNRALKLKVKTKEDVDRSSQPYPQTKPGHTLSSPSSFLGSPRKKYTSTHLFNSPKSSLLDSPKSSFFNGPESSQLLLKTCPKNFFDNSSLGSLPDVDIKDESPRLEDQCTTQ